MNKIKEQIVSYDKMTINNYEQWVCVRGDITKPILLLLHGGPGTPCMSLFRQRSKTFLEDFLVVTWDQRGTGRSYSDDMDVSAMTVNQIVEDTHTLTQYLLETYNKEKLYLLGHSFGATVGLRVAHERPEYYYAYMGVSQFVNASQNELLCYNWLVDTATQKGDKKALRMLETIGAPVDGFYTDGLGGTIKAKQLVDKYKGSTYNGGSMLSLIVSLLFSSEYGGHRFGNAIKGINKSLATIGYNLKGIDYTQTVPSMDIPVYFFSGKYDMLTPQSILHEYYDMLDAPKKELYTFDKSAHNLLWEENEKFHSIVKEIIHSK